MFFLYDEPFRVVFESLNELMASPEPKRNPVGFSVKERRAGYSAHKTTLGDVGDGIIRYNAISREAMKVGGGQIAATPWRSRKRMGEAIR